MINIIFTIDDGPNDWSLEKAYWLYENKIPAIWFMVGNKMLSNYQIAKEILNLGFEIGNHSFSHVHFSELNIDEQNEEINKTEDIIDRLYLEMGKIRRQKLFRYPFGDIPQNPVKNILWNLDCKDWNPHMDHQKLISNFIPKKENIVLLHDIEDFEVFKMNVLKIKDLGDSFSDNIPNFLLRYPEWLLN